MRRPTCGLPLRIEQGRVYHEVGHDLAIDPVRTNLSRCHLAPELEDPRVFLGPCRKLGLLFRALSVGRGITSQGLELWFLRVQSCGRTGT